MTVYELIEKLQECDLPDAQVQILTWDGRPNPTPTDVYYKESTGPVLVDISK